MAPQRHSTSAGAPGAGTRSVRVTYTAKSTGSPGCAWFDASSAAPGLGLRSPLVRTCTSRDITRRFCEAWRATASDADPAVSADAADTCVTRGSCDLAGDGRRAPAAAVAAAAGAASLHALAASALATAALDGAPSLTPRAASLAPPPPSTTGASDRCSGRAFPPPPPPPGVPARWRRAPLSVMSAAPATTAAADGGGSAGSKRRGPRGLGGGGSEGGSGICRPCTAGCCRDAAAAACCCRDAASAASHCHTHRDWTSFESK